MTSPALSAHAVTVKLARDVTIGPATFTVPRGRLTAVIGPNGAGKSTLLRALAGITTPTTGSVSLDGEEVASIPRRDRARRIAFVEQSPATDVNLSAGEVVMLGRIPHAGRFASPDQSDHDSCLAAMRATRTNHVRSRPFSRLSGGEQQRVLLARAIAQEPEVLVLDEPTNHLDVRAQLEVLTLARELTAGGATVVAAIHDLSLAAEHADHVVVVDRGHVHAEGAPDEVLDAALFRDVFGVHAEFIDRPGAAQVIAFRPLAD